MARHLTLAICVSIGALLCSWSTASATTVELTKYDGVYPGASFNGADAVGGTSFFSLEQIDIDQANNFIYSASNGQVYKTDLLGVSQPFSGLGGNTAFSQSSGFYGDIEVDNSGTATQGNIYLVNDSSSFFGYSPAGTALTGYPVANGGETCGIAVGPDGHIWAGNYPNTVKEYDPSTSPPTFVKSVSFSPSTNGICDFDMDSQGNFLMTNSYSGGPVYRYPPSGTGRTLIDSANASGVVADLSNDHTYVTVGNAINHHDASGALIDTFGGVEGPPSEFPGLQSARGLAVDEANHKVYVANKRSPNRVDRFAPTGPITIPTVTTSTPEVEPTAAVLHGVVNGDGIDTTDCQFEWGPIGNANYGNKIECAEGKIFTGGSGDHAVSAEISGLAKGSTYHFRITSKNANEVVAKGGDREFTASGTPVGLSEGVSKINTDGVQFNVTIDPNGGVTTFHVEWGLEAGVYGNVFPDPDGQLATKSEPESFSQFVSGLTADTEYHYRLIADNDAGTYTGPDRTFKTFPPPPPNDPCGNALERKQTGASLLMDCRAYELVSAADQSGYDVESDLVGQQVPLMAHPRAEERLIYSLHHGALPDAQNPTNLGHDPYVASRGIGEWTTEYVGLPAAGLPSDAPYGSPLLGADAGLDSFAFGGAGICDPCFADGSTNIPLRLSNGNLVKGMDGSEEPGPADPVGQVDAPFSADGSHFVFGSDKEFEPAGNPASLTIYDRNLTTGTTQVVSTLPGGATMTGSGIAELDISADGNRILIGKLVSTDPEGNQYFDLYMHVGATASSIPVADTAKGVIYGGMKSDGSQVFFTAPDKLADDADDSPDLFRADVGAASATVSRVSTGTGGTGQTDLCAPATEWNVVSGGPNCGTLAFAGGAGVAAGDGTVYFLSPEKLDGAGNGVQDQANLYVVAPGGSPKFVATVDTATGKETIDDPAITRAREDAGSPGFGDIQVTPDGTYAAFNSARPIAGLDTKGHYAIYRYETTGAGALECVSCGPSSITDSTLTPTGLNLADDGRAFFTSAEQFVLRDTNEKKDAYEWQDGIVQIISSGTSPVDSGMVTVSADGVDAFFFTRDSLAPQDENGSPMKIYTAREDGGFLYTAPPFPCAASDECHGPGTQAAPPPDIDTFEGSGRSPETQPLPKRCKKGFVKKKGKCVKKKKSKKANRKKKGSR